MLVSLTLGSPVDNQVENYANRHIMRIDGKLFESMAIYANRRLMRIDIYLCDPTTIMQIDDQLCEPTKN